MRTSHFWIFCNLLLLVACRGPENSASLHDVVTAGTARVTVNPFPLDSLLGMNNAELIKIFGSQSLVVKSADGFDGDDPFIYAMLFEGTDREVELMLEDSTDTGQVISATVRTSSHWTTRDGLTPGMKLKDLEQINGKSFLFYGGGWDHGGYVTNWNRGKLEGRIKACRLDRNYLMPYDLSKGDYDVHEFSSGSNDAQRGNPVIEEVTVGKI